MWRNDVYSRGEYEMNNCKLYYIGTTKKGELCSLDTRPIIANYYLPNMFIFKT